jgi:ribosomal protein S18 acetylase RimI-like enzyme
MPVRDDRLVSATIRLAHRHEAAVLAALHRETAIVAYRHIFPEDAPPPTPDEVLAQWTQWLGPDRDAGRRAFVAEEHAAVVGVVVAGPDPIEPGTGHVGRLYVTPDRWGRGIGRALYEAAMSHLTGAGFDEATLWVLEGNTRARGWYERLGWRATGERKAVFAPAGIDDLRYRIALEH